MFKILEDAKRSAVLAVAAAALAVVASGATGAPSTALSFGASGALEGWIAAVADFNGDGKPDLAVVNAPKVTVLLGDGAGHFEAAPAPSANVGANPSFAASDDFNGDGRADVAIANCADLCQDQRTSDSVYVLLGNGAGGFQAAPSSPVKLVDSPSGLAAADLNGDGNDDLIVPVGLGTTAERLNGNRVEVLLGDASGRLTRGAGPLVSGAAPIAVADFDGDARRDLVVTEGEAHVSVVLGDGTGRFRKAPGSPIAVGKHPGSIAGGDFDRDGATDFAVGTAAGSVILLGNGKGGFRKAPGSPFKNTGAGMAADVDGDGNLDLVSESRVALGNGKAGFAARGASFSFPATPFGVRWNRGIFAASDLNGDGKPDLVLRSLILFQGGTTPLPAAGRAPVRAQSLSTRAAITLLAADGRRVAVATTSGKSYPADGKCGRVVVWTAPRRRSASFAASACDDGEVEELAVAGNRVAWIATYGNSFDQPNEANDRSTGLNVVAATLPGAKVRKVATSSVPYEWNGNPSGEWVGRLSGAGTLLAYNGWRLSCHVGALDYCGDAQIELSHKSLVRVAPGGRAVVGRGPASAPLLAVGGGRMAVFAGRSVAVLRPSGVRVASIPVGAIPPRAAALNRTELAIQSPLTLDLYNPASGTKTNSLPLGPSATLELAGLNAKLALLRGTDRAVLVRLGDGKLVSLPLHGVIGPKLTESGLFYAYNTPKAAMKGHIVFEPTAKLLARF